MARLRPQYFDLIRLTSGGPVYPDANSTLRVTFGNVEGYTVGDATWFLPQTTLAGVLQKEEGDEPFDSPKALLAAAREPSKTRPYVNPDLRDVPVNFLSTCDTTGANSGSPTLNAKGELVSSLEDALHSRRHHVHVVDHGRRRRRAEYDAGDGSDTEVLRPVSLP